MLRKKKKGNCTRVCIHKHMFCQCGKVTSLKYVFNLTLVYFHINVMEVFH